MRTIKEVEAQVEEKVSEALTEALRRLDVLPNGYSPRVRFHGESKRKKQNASFEKNWSPNTDSILITFERIPEPMQASSQPIAGAPAATPANSAPKSGSATDPVCDLIKALDHAESQPGYNFVALKWFRDTALPSGGFAWASPDAVRDVLREAIDQRLILTSKVPNPRSPQFPVTAIRLNRLMPKVKAVLGIRDEGLPDFQPVPIRGEDLSATILRERR